MKIINYSAFLYPFFLVQTVLAQQPSVAVINISVRGMLYEQAVVANMVRKELLKSTKYLVTDPFEAAEQLKKSGVDPSGCFDRECLGSAAAAIGVQKALTGGIERIGDKMTVTLTIIDGASKTIEKTSTGEYVYNTDYVDNIIGVAVKKLMDIPVDQQILDVVTARKEPVVNLYNTVHASGPRIGLTYITGYMQKRLGDPENRGGYDMSPMISQFGYQFESQYYSSGYMQTLIEVLFFIGGIESGRFIPTCALMNGFRDGKSGIELALGPVFWMATREQGFYDDTGLWRRRKDLNIDSLMAVNPDQEFYELPDKDGKPRPGFGLVVSVGKTFRSGNLNIPVNVYMIPQQHRKEGWEFGVSLGFNVSKK